MSKFSDRIVSYAGAISGGASRRDSQAKIDRQILNNLSGKRVPNAKQLKYLPKFLSGKEMRVVRTLLAIIIVTVGVIGYRFAKQHIVTVPTKGGDYVEAVVGTPKYVNPVLAFSNDVDLDLVNLVFSGLVRTAPDGTIVPDLAESYEISEDGKTYTFVLRENIAWHDETAFSSRDVVATLAYLKSSGWKSPYAAQFSKVTAEAPDERTVVFNLEEPFAPFLSALTVGILPHHLWQDVIPENAARADLNIKPVGTGPFKFKSFTKDKRGAILTYTVSRNDYYYGDKPLLDTITFRTYGDFVQAAEALSSRKADGISFLPLELREDAQTQRNLRTYTLRLPQYTAIFFNKKKNPALESKSVRQALAQAIDRSKLVDDTLGSGGVVVNGPILAGFIGFHPDVKKLEHDLDAAAAALDEAGWKVDGDDGVRKKGIVNAEKETVQTPLVIAITTADARENVEVADAIKESWELLGIQVELDILPASRIQKDAIRPHEYQALLYGQILGPDPDPYPFWHSSQIEKGLNLAGFSNRRADELLEKGRAMSSNDDRAAAYREFQDLLAADTSAIMLYSPAYAYAVNRRVLGIETSTIFSPADRFDTVTDWYIETKWEWR